MQDGHAFCRARSSSRRRPAACGRPAGRSSWPRSTWRSGSRPGSGRAASGRSSGAGRWSTVRVRPGRRDWLKVSRGLTPAACAAVTQRRAARPATSCPARPGEVVARVVDPQVVEALVGEHSGLLVGDADRHVRRRARGQREAEQQRERGQQARRGIEPHRQPLSGLEAGGLLVHGPRRLGGIAPRPGGRGGGRAAGVLAAATRPARSSWRRRSPGRRAPRAARARRRRRRGAAGERLDGGKAEALVVAGNTRARAPE